MGKIDLEKIKTFLKEKKTVKTLIWIISILIILLIIWLFVAIYTDDKPKIIPEETRGQIREGIKDQIARPIESLVPSVGKAMLNAAYSIPTANTTNSNLNLNINPADNWKTYKSEEYGFEVKYPEDWNYSNQDLYGLPNKVEKMYSLDPNSSDKTIAQIFLEISDENQIQAEDRALANISNMKTSNITVSGVSTNKYEGDIIDLGSGKNLGRIIYIIIPKNGHTYIFSYNTNRTNSKDLTNQFNEIVKSFKI